MSVFARPGTSSSSTCPSASRPASTSSSRPRLPTTARSTSSARPRRVPRARSAAREAFQGVHDPLQGRGRQPGRRDRPGPGGRGGRAPRPPARGRAQRVQASCPGRSLSREAAPPRASEGSAEADSGRRTRCRPRARPRAPCARTRDVPAAASRARMPRRTPTAPWSGAEQCGDHDAESDRENDDEPDVADERGAPRNNGQDDPRPGADGKDYGDRAVDPLHAGAPTRCASRAASAAASSS